MPALRTRDTHPAVRSLEVSTAAPPSLTIISPTPRAFTFPIAHNLSDSPYSSPSSSPFEPDLRALALSASPASTPSSSVSSHSQNDACRTPPPLSAFTRTLSPASACGPASPPPAHGPVRRKSTSGSAAGGPEERRPKKGDEDYVKRPENAFILFRRKCCEDRALGLSSPPLLPPKQRQADLSKTISQQWKALAPEERAHWEALAKEKKREHEALHPDYVYRPQRAANKNRSAAAASSSSPNSSATASPSAARRKHSAPPQGQQVEFVLPAPRAAHGRSASAPTPPPYQAIQIPNVYFGSPASSFSSSGEESPTSLMPMISRRAVSGGGGGFDYMPSFAGAFEFEASLQSSDFLRAMFPPSVSPLTTSTSPTSGGILSPASSTSGSGPSSPYTPASASFHPSAFTSSYSSPSPATSSSAYPQSGAQGQEYAPGLLLESPMALDAGLSMHAGEMGMGMGMEADYTSYASAWAAASPWASAAGMGGGAGLQEGDFDIGRIPEIGWEGCAGMGAAGFGSSFAAFPGDAQHDFDAGEGGGYAGEGEGEDEFSERRFEGGGELDLHFGEMDMGMGLEMGFDEMMAGRGF
ncbi:hypothetical protein DFH09DRAFT_1086678 [Mycena vulgaris]|nr:hypothetical protein DFH09DRAFT_1086678 [Mycena vulgaris]